MAARVIALCGLPGSGKSTLARAIEAVTGWQRLDRDALRARQFSCGGYSRAEKDALNLLMHETMNAHLRRGESVILDGMTFARAEDRAWFAGSARAAGAGWTLVWLDCAPQLACARVAMDAEHLARDRDANLVLAVAARFEAPADALRIDATCASTAQRDAVLALLAERGG